MATEVGLEAVAAVVTLQHTHQVADVGGRQPQRLDFAELRVRGNVGNAVPQVRERVVDTLRPPGNNTGILYKVVSAVLIGELTTITRDSYTTNKYITSYRLIIVYVISGPRIYSRYNVPSPKLNQKTTIDYVNVLK